MYSDQLASLHCFQNRKKTLFSMKRANMVFFFNILFLFLLKKLFNEEYFFETLVMNFSPTLYPPLVFYQYQGPS